MLKCRFWTTRVSDRESGEWFLKNTRGKNNRRIFVVGAFINIPIVWAAGARVNYICGVNPPISGTLSLGYPWSRIALDQGPPALLRSSQSCSRGHWDTPYIYTAPRQKGTMKPNETEQLALPKHIATFYCFSLIYLRSLIKRVKRVKVLNLYFVHLRRHSEWLWVSNICITFRWHTQNSFDIYQCI